MSIICSIQHQAPNSHIAEFRNGPSYLSPCGPALLPICILFQAFKNTLERFWVLCIAAVVYISVVNHGMNFHHLRKCLLLTTIIHASRVIRLVINRFSSLLLFTLLMCIASAFCIKKSCYTPAIKKKTPWISICGYDPSLETFCVSKCQLVLALGILCGPNKKKKKKTVRNTQLFLINHHNYFCNIWNIFV